MSPRAWLLVAVLLPGSSNVWTDAGRIWAGNQQCQELGMIPEASNTDVVDQGAFIEGFHCPAAGVNGSGCTEWFGKAPDIGACEYVPALIGQAPKGRFTLEVK